MARVRTDPNALRRVAAAIEGTDRTVAEAVSAVRAALDQVDWHDDVRRSFDSKFEELMRATRNFHRQAETAAPFLKKKAGQLDNYLRP